MGYTAHTPPPAFKKTMYQDEMGKEIQEYVIQKLTLLSRALRHVSMMENVGVKTWE